MPMRHEKQKIKLPAIYDRRRKITNDEREGIKYLYFIEARGIREIARIFSHISRRAIQFIIFPERLEHARALYKERRVDGRYYQKEKNTRAVKEHRRYKRDILCLLEKKKVEKKEK